MSFNVDDLSVSDISVFIRNENTSTSTDPLPFLEIADESASVTSASSRRDKISRGIATLFFEVEDESLLTWALKPISYFDDPASRIKNWCGQFETCPDTGKLHIHICFEFTSQVRFEFVRDAFTSPSAVIGCNIKKGRGRSDHAIQSAINYCIDPQKRAKAPFHEEYIWPGSSRAITFDEKCAAKKKASKEDVIKVKIDKIKTFPYWMSWETIVHSSHETEHLFFGCTASERFHKTRHAAQPRRTIESVEIHFGAGGTGKSTYARQLGAKLGEKTGRDERYVRNYDDGNFWGGGMTKYQSQLVIHLEEFEGQETLSKFKEICDIGACGPNVNVKNGGTRLNHTHVVITSNTHPAGFYRGVWNEDPKQFAPFWRRVTKVVFYPSHLPDGSLNAPKCDDDVFSVDQTDEWKNLGGDYNGAVMMAKRDWPLKEVDEYRDGALASGFNIPVLKKPTLKRSRPYNDLFEYAITGKDPSVNRNNF